MRSGGYCSSSITEAARKNWRSMVLDILNLRKRKRAGTTTNQRSISMKGKRTGVSRVASKFQSSVATPRRRHRLRHRPQAISCQQGVASATPRPKMSEVDPETRPNSNLCIAKNVEQRCRCCQESSTHRLTYDSEICSA